MLRYISPFRCLICNNPHWRGYDLCSDCEAELPLCTQACQQCGAALQTDDPTCGQCIQSPPPFVQTIAATWYHDVAQQLVTKLKYSHQLPATRVMTALMLSC